MRSPRTSGASRPWSTLPLLGLAGSALVVLLMLFGWMYVNVPPGWSPRLGNEADVTALFPRFWNVRAFRVDPAQFTSRAKLLISALWIAYVVAAASVLRLPADRRPRAFRVVVAVTAIAQVVLVVMPPVVCGDLFHYALFGRMVSHYGLNPYVTAATRLKTDSIWPYASWNFLTTHYGPAFTWLSAAMTSLSDGRVFWTAVSFKALMASASLASCWLVRDISARCGGSDGLDAAALYALNPLVLIESAGMGHNEALVVAYALGGVSLAVRGHPWFAFSLFLLSADVKSVTASLAVLFAVQFVVQAPDWRARLLRVTGLLALSVVVELLLWAPFWRGSEVFATSRALLTRGSPARAVTPIQLALFGTLVLACAVAASRGSMALILNLTSAVGLIFVTFVFPWQYAWYTIPSLAFAAAAPRTRANVVLLTAVVVFGLLFTLPYVHLHAEPAERPVASLSPLH